MYIHVHVHVVVQMYVCTCHVCITYIGEYTVHVHVYTVMYKYISISTYLFITLFIPMQYLILT